jgi:hypothetical protein
MAAMPQPGQGSTAGAGPSGPGAGGAPPDQNSSPVEGQKNPALANALSELTDVANKVRKLGQAYPQVSQEARQVGELLQRMLMKTTQAQAPSEPAAPPV